jgi:hypothetical protein
MGFVLIGELALGASAVYSTKATQGVSKHSSLKVSVFRVGVWQTRQRKNVAALFDYCNSRKIWKYSTLVMGVMGAKRRFQHRIYYQIGVQQSNSPLHLQPKLI